MNIQYDRPLKIALGVSRCAKRWKNRTLRWGELLDRLSSFVVTNETQAEYRAADRDRQAEIKDVGAFVGGYLQDGDRKKVVSRSVLCLDADFAAPGASLWRDWQVIYENAACVYSTHKYTPESPRLRLVIPLARDITPDEYAAIGRRIAADLGVDQFDDTTYQAQRLMFWPSRSRDGEEVFRFQDGPLLDPDAVLARYEDWRDVSAWPVSSRVGEIIQKSAATQADPETKPGLIGAFCRVYAIEDAIAAFLPDVYLPCDPPGRYTYAGGSTVAGAVIYEGKFLYSHHATDPAGGRLLNAWDLVRLHRFGGLDEGKDPDTPPGRLPSQKAMEALALKDDQVRVEAVNEHTADVSADFAVLDEEDWRAQLELTQEGGVRSTIGNIRLILEYDPDLRGALAWDEMNNLPAIRRDLPWREVKLKHEGFWQNGDDAQLRLWLERKYAITGRDKILDGVETTARAHSFHPVRDYIRSKPWDGVPRVETQLIRYLGAEDTPYVRAVTRKTLAAAVARVFRPGVKFDHVLTLQGGQGIGKSTWIALLAGAWYSDSFFTVTGKDALDQTRRVWVVEMGELAGLKKAEVESIKLFISRQEDQYRPAYGRQVEIFPRQCIFIATTNELEFLRDTTGNRRFWVVGLKGGGADMRGELTPEVVQQIWAEAYHYYAQGEELFLPRELEREARAMQRGYAESDDRTGIVQNYLARKLPENWADMDLYARREWLSSDAEGTAARKRVCRIEVWCEALGGPMGKLERYESRAIGAMLEECGWGQVGPRPFGKIYGSQKAFEPRKDVFERLK